jgi:hypothetical protein
VTLPLPTADVAKTDHELEPMGLRAGRAAAVDTAAAGPARATVVGPGRFVDSRRIVTRLKGFWKTLSDHRRAPRSDG